MKRFVFIVYEITVLQSNVRADPLCYQTEMLLNHN